MFGFVFFDLFIGENSVMFVSLFYDIVLEIYVKEVKEVVVSFEFFVDLL